MSHTVDQEFEARDQADELMDNVLDASQSGYITLVSAKLDDDGYPIVKFDRVSYLASSEEQAKKGLMALIDAIINHSKFLRGSLHVHH
jgi:hypothetical protein